MSCTTLVGGRSGQITVITMMRAREAAVAASADSQKRARINIKQ
tara:strand:- start:746 stop:877 length:132 start_codon:yes stop_codon:yes gene_type:complete